MLKFPLYGYYPIHPNKLFNKPFNVSMQGVYMSYHKNNRPVGVRIAEYVYGKFNYDPYYSYNANGLFTPVWPILNSYIK